MSYTQFDLEQEIMECWRVTDDLRHVYQYVLNGDSNELNRDKVANMLLGMNELYNLKFEQCFKTFEKLLAERHQERLAQSDAGGV